MAKFRIKPISMAVKKHRKRRVLVGRRSLRRLSGGPLCGIAIYMCPVVGGTLPFRLNGQVGRYDHVNLWVPLEQDYDYAPA